MGLREQINDDMKAAMRAKEELRLSTLRMVRAEILKLEKDGRGADAITDDDVQGMLRSLIKQRRDAAEAFRQGGRPDMAESEEAEAAILKTYLPAELSDEELAAIVRDVIASTGASSPKDLGKVMGPCMAKAKATGKMADGGKLRQIATGLLGG